MNRTEIFDISIAVRTGIANWPGDVPYEIKTESRADFNLSAVSMSLHTGTHVDAPYHFDPAGDAVADLDLSAFNGPACVIDVRGKTRIQVRDIEESGILLAPRVLLKTGAWTDHAAFPKSIPVIEPYVPAFLSERGVRLLGVDVPSVDALDSKDLPNHHSLARRGINILESVDLSGVAPGQYHLVALPLRLVGADASPCRAMLIREP